MTRSPSRSPEDIDVGLRAQYASLHAPQPSLLANRMQEAQLALQQLKQVAGGAGEASRHFLMVHFGSATPAVIEPPVVKHAPAELVEPDEPAMPQPKQFIDNEPPFGSSFMDNMSVELGLNEPIKVPLHSFTLDSLLISSTHESAVDMSDLQTHSENEDGLLHLEAPPPPAPWVGGVRPAWIGTWLETAAVPALFICLSMRIMGTATRSALCGEVAPQSAVVSGDYCCYQNGTVDILDTVFLGSGASNNYNLYNLDPGVIDSDTAGVFNLPDSIDNNK
ncbi:hypothetical protein CYMTET_11392 [Cymbomonas tetramitiformis]|uniref:Uncharacterized protein n=1 Tax=Cymbomonas tetramitiformis TaxID=36881 RepID=A0AAE0LCW4_9CHLO|nr:hypothetical protein CYMTET_41797 [Cymbomonas tetramitiformis]KAK3280786.1 hypothetical protein CYMTET_11392 [Cymbomonas tetramitiformis]